MTKYKDNNGTPIEYGDILKVLPLEEQCKHPFSPPAPFAMLTIKDSKDMVYISGMDEFQEISGWQKEEDRFTNKISSVEIFAHRCVYEANLKKNEE